MRPDRVVTKPEIVTPESIRQMYISFTVSPSGVCWITISINGRTTKMQKQTKAAQERKTHKVAKGMVSFSAKVMAKASSTHAQTSLMSAEDMAILPRSVFRSFSSARILAKTGNAVMHNDTPRNRTNNLRVRTTILDPISIERMQKAVGSLPNTKPQTVPGLESQGLAQEGNPKDLAKILVRLVILNGKERRQRTAKETPRMEVHNLIVSVDFNPPCRSISNPQGIASQKPPNAIVSKKKTQSISG
nr:Cation/H(+) antiporter like [Ipomoea batatas]